MADPDLSARLAQIHAAAFTTPRPWAAPEITSLLEGRHVFLLTEGAPGSETSFLIGSAIAGEAELLTIAVAPDHRRHGLGARLLDRFLVEAGQRGAGMLFLEVAADNAAAIALYQRVGFHATGRRRNYYHSPDGRAVDALVMSRAL